MKYLISLLGSNLGSLHTCLETGFPCKGHISSSEENNLRNVTSLYASHTSGIFTYSLIFIVSPIELWMNSYRLRRDTWDYRRGLGGHKLRND